MAFQYRVVFSLTHCELQKKLQIPSRKINDLWRLLTRAGANFYKSRCKWVRNYKRRRKAIVTTFSSQTMNCTFAPKGAIARKWTRRPCRHHRARETRNEKGVHALLCRDKTMRHPRKRSAFCCVRRRSAFDSRLTLSNL